MTQSLAFQPVCRSRRWAEPKPAATGRHHDARQLLDRAARSGARPPGVRRQDRPPSRVDDAVAFKGQCQVPVDILSPTG